MNKQDVKLDPKWEQLAGKELKGKNVKDVLVRETNEQMLIKPLYTQEDWKPPAHSEIPGRYNQPSSNDTNLPSLLLDNLSPKL